MRDPSALLRAITRNTEFTSKTTALDEIDMAARIVAHAYFGPKGDWSYESFEYLNRELWQCALPQPLILWVMTAHGRCLGLTAHREERPVVTLHPTLLGARCALQTGRKNSDPWQIPNDLLGPAYAWDVLLHELIHVAVENVLGGRGDGTSSHDCDAWVSEVNRIAPLIGLEGVRAERSKVVRQGKKSVRINEGNVPFAAVATFPHSVRMMRGQQDHYRQPPPVRL